MKRPFLICLLIIAAGLTAVAQPISLDSLTLFTSDTIPIKSIHVSENSNFIVVGWQTELDSVYFQVFNKQGLPHSDTIKILSREYRGGPYVRTMSMDVAITQDDRIAVAWAEHSYLTDVSVRYAVYDIDGKRLTDPAWLGSLEKKLNFIAFAKNDNGTVAIAWQEKNKIGVQHISPDGSLIASPSYNFLQASPDQRSWSPHIDASDRVFISYGTYGWLETGPSGGSAGVAPSNRPPFDIDFFGDRTVSLIGTGQGIHSGAQASFSSINPTASAELPVDDAKASWVSVDLEDQGCLLAWQNLNGQVKLNYIMRSGQAVGNPAILPNSNSMISLYAAVNDGVAQIIYGEKSGKGTVIRLQRFHFNPFKEEKEMPVNDPIVYTGNYGSWHKVITNGTDKHVVVWQYTKYDQTGAHLYAQRLDENYEAVGTRIDITNTASHNVSPVGGTDIDAAMDGDGNFMVVWKGTSGRVFASKYLGDGTPLFQDFVVSDEEGMWKGNSSPRVAANRKGDFLVTWTFGEGGDYGVAKARKWGENFSPVIKLPVYGEDDTNRVRPRLDMNEDGWIVYAHKVGWWQALRCVIYDENLQLVGSLTKPFNSLDDDYDVALTNSLHLVVSMARSDALRTQVFDVSGSPAIPIFNPATTALGPENVITHPFAFYDVSLSENAAGNFAITYNSYLSMMIQRFNDIGEAVGEPMWSMPFLSGAKQSIAYLDNNHTLSTWFIPSTKQVFKRKIFIDKQSPEVNDVYVQIEEGGTYDFYGTILTKAGRYSKVFKRSNQADKIELLNLSIIPGSPPSGPTQLKGVATGKTIRISWFANTEPNLKGYILYRNIKDDLASATELIRTPKLLYVDQDIIESKKYYYWLKAERFLSGTGPGSEVLVVTAANRPPLAPTGLIITSSQYDITIKWNASIENDLREYEIHRGDAEKDFELLTTQRESSLNDTSVKYGMIYRYKVYAVDSAGNKSEPSGFVVGFRVNQTPVAPAILSLTFVEDKVELSWTKSTEPDVTSYRVYRNKVDDPTDATVLGETKESSFVDDQPMPDKNFYWVRALDDGGMESGPGLGKSLTVEVPGPEVITAMADDPRVVSVYPNPTADEVYFEQPVEEFASITLSDGRGSAVPVIKGSMPNSISLAEIPAGVYVLKVQRQKGGREEVVRVMRR